jgi:hypothetical protein
MARLPERTGFGKEVMFLPVFRFNKAFGIGWNLKAFLNLHTGVTRGAVPDLDRDLERDVNRYKEQANKLRIARQKDRQLIKEQRKKIKEQSKALSHARQRIKENEKKSAQNKQEILRQKNELRAAEERVEGATKDQRALQAEGEPKPGALPDFVIAGEHKGAPIIGAGRSGSNDQSMDDSRLIVRPRGGLGNRMEVITSFQLLARYSGRVFELCWAPSSGFSDEDLDDLFENDFPRVSLDEFERYSHDGLHLHDAVVRKVGPANERTWEWREGKGIHQVFDLEAFPVVTYTGNHPWERLVDPATWTRLFPNLKKSNWKAALKEWSPVPSIRAKVEELAASFGPYTVGVHIRRGDAWKGGGRLASESMRSSDAAFIAYMEAELVAEPRTNFFLATDCAATEERFRERYQEAVIVNRDKRFVPSVLGQPKDNQRDAVIDMFALARTRKILGNNLSTFSRMAAKIGGISYQKVLEDQLPDSVRRSRA